MISSLVSSATALLDIGFSPSADGWIHICKKIDRLCITATTRFAKLSTDSKPALERNFSRSSQTRVCCHRAKYHATRVSARHASAMPSRAPRHLPPSSPRHPSLYPSRRSTTFFLRDLSSAARAWPPATRATRSIWPSSSTGPVRRCSCGRWTRRSWSASGGARRCE